MRRFLILAFAAFSAFWGQAAHADATTTYGTLVCTSAGTIAAADANFAITDLVTISLNLVGGTISTAPAVKTVTAGTGFSVLCATSDTSTYNWTAVKYK